MFKIAEWAIILIAIAAVILIALFPLYPFECFTVFMAGLFIYSLYRAIKKPE